MGNPAVKRGGSRTPTEAAVGYASEGDTIFIQTGKQVRDGEEIAEGIVVLYDGEDGNNVVGITISGAEGVLKPFVDAILIKYGLSENSPAHRDQRFGNPKGRRQCSGS